MPTRSGEEPFINDGQGKFQNEIAERLPLSVLQGQGTSDFAAFGDMDNDGDLDLVRVARYCPKDDTNDPGCHRGNGQTGLFLNDGNGFFSDATMRLPDDSKTNTEGLALSDIDGDDDLDIIVTSEDNFDVGALMGMRIFVNQGGARFQDFSKQLVPATLLETPMNLFAVADVDGDQDLDIVIANGEEPIVLFNDGTGKFGIRGKFNGYGSAIALGDLDMDGDPDLIAGSPGQDLFNKLLVFLNDGRGNFTNISDRVLPSLPAKLVIRELDLVDVDQDGDLDIYVGTGIDRAGIGRQRDILLINQLPEGTKPGSLPDADGDGIPDKDDFCPNFPGKPETNGC